MKPFNHWRGAIVWGFGQYNMASGPFCFLVLTLDTWNIIEKWECGIGGDREYMDVKARRL